MFLALKLSDVLFIMLIHVKMPTIGGILSFISMINFMLRLVEHEFFCNLVSWYGHLLCHRQFSRELEN